MNVFRIVALLSVLLISFSTFANESGGYSSKYTTTYETWDSEFYEYYEYDERDYGWSDCDYYTCYDGWHYSDTVYVEETIVQRGPYAGYTRVVVYRDYGYRNAYVTYYTYNGRIVRRTYHRRHRHVHYDYVHYSHRHYHTTYYVELDDISAKIIAGILLIDAGVDVATTNCDGCAELGLASAILGSASLISASIEEEARRTELERRVRARERSKDTEVIDIE